MCLRILQQVPAKLGRSSPFPTGLRWMPCRTIQQLWCRWRRLLLRFLLSASLQAWQVLQEAVRTPQLREVRWLQQRREHLEQQAFQLAQEEQRVLAEAHVTTPSALTGSLAMARREERVRPLAMVKGKGRFLVPALEPSPGCTHPEVEVKHGANRVLSWQECNQCQQKQIMPLTPITELHNWNQNLVYIPDVFYDVRKKSTKSKKGSSDASSPLQRAHPEPWPTSPRHDHRWSSRRSSRTWTRSGRTRIHGAMWWRTTC